MADKLFISKLDFSAYRDISEHIDDDRINASILESQVSDLIPFIGEALYKVLQDDFTAPDTWTTPKYDELFDGATYKPQGKSYDVIYHGIRPMLVYYTYARLLNTIQMNVSRSGPVTYMNGDISDPAIQAQIKTKVIDARAMATRYMDEVVTFLETNKSDYPEWDNPRQGTLAFKFIKL